MTLAFKPVVLLIFTIDTATISDNVTEPEQTIQVVYNDRVEFIFVFENITS